MLLPQNHTVFVLLVCFLFLRPCAGGGLVGGLGGRREPPKVKVK
jgi:hypothetical protein